MQNDQTINVQICEEDIEEKKIPQIKNLESNNNVINTTDGYSNNNNTITNHLNNQTNHSNLIVINNLPKSKNPKKK
jgi:phosphoglycerol transferase MdoB-like AlkP superfamily enzyme